MKIKEFFGFSGPETLQGADAPEKAPASKKNIELGETERKYMSELKDYQEYTNKEIMGIETEFQEKIKTAPPEEFARLKEEKDRKQELLRKNLQKVRMNLEEGLTDQWRMKDKE